MPPPSLLLPLSPPTCPQAGHHQGEQRLVLLLRHVVEGPAQVLGLVQAVGEHLQPGTLRHHLAAVGVLGDPHVAVGRVGVGLAVEVRQLPGVDGEHLARA